MLYVIVMILIFLLFYRQRKAANFPPGPPRLPILGSLPFIRLAEYGTTTFNRINGLSEKYGKVCGFYGASTPVVILADIDIIKQVYKMPEAAGRTFASGAARVPLMQRYGTKHSDMRGLLFSSGKIWSEQRRFALRHLKDFGFGKKSMEETIQAEASRLCNVIAEDDLDKPTRLDSRLNIAIINALWKILVNDELDMQNQNDVKVVDTLNQFVRNSGGSSLLVQMFPFLGNLFPNLFFGDVVKTLDEIKGLIRPYREMHRKTLDTDQPRDFLDMHISAQLVADQGSTFHGVLGQQNEEINILDLFLAGTETTSTTIMWGVLYLLHHPEVQERLHAELDSVVGRDRLPSLEDESKMPYMCATIHEIHRSASIVFFGVPHHTSTPIDVGGYTIPGGTTILANISHVMHDPEVFDDPDLFNPDRFIDKEGRFRSSPHVIPFLVGKRQCLGTSLAEKELFLFFSQLLLRFTFKPVPGQKVPSYSFYLRDKTTPNNLIRFCPVYDLIISSR